MRGDPVARLEASKLKKLVSTCVPVISWKPNCTSFARTSSRKLRYGCFLPGQVLATGASMLYFWNLVSRHLPVIISSGVSLVTSGTDTVASEAAFLPSSLICSTRVVLGSMVTSLRFLSCSAASLSSGLKSSWADLLFFAQVLEQGFVAALRNRHLMQQGIVDG